MNTDVKESEFAEGNSDGFTVGADSPKFGVDSEPGMLPTLFNQSSGDQWKQVAERVYQFLAGLPEFVSEFFGEYRRPLITLGLIFGSIVSVKLTLALLDAIDDIPLLAPTFELIGMVFTAWFIYRYLWKASNRQELASQLNDWKSQVLGSGTPKS